MAVVAGFVHKTREELETLVEEMMRGVQGYNVMEIVDINPRLALEKFDAPLQATKFIRGRRNPTVQTYKSWVSENRSKMERLRSKSVNKLKSMSIELNDFEPANIIANYKKFTVMTCIDGKLVALANVRDDLGGEWLDKNNVNEDVRKAMDFFVSNFEP